MEIRGSTTVYGIIGYPVKHSLSPLMQTAAFQEAGIDAVYVPFEVKPEHLKTALDGIRALNVMGVNVTIPHKERVVEFIDFLDEDAEFLGAVNTIKNVEGKLHGYNTDAVGFYRSLVEEGIALKGKTAVMFGAGGAAKAVGYALLKGGVKFLHIFNRNFSRAKELGDLLSRLGNVLVYPLKESAVETVLPTADVIVNTTSVGMKSSDPHLFDYSKIPEGKTVVDIIYTPPETELLKAAKKKGCKVVNGLGMLLYQGVAAFEIWTGRKAPAELMKKVLLEELYG